MKKYIYIAVLVNLVGLLIFFNYSVLRKENTLKNGKLILIRLAPVDPRSLMQGDYMRLNYEISNQLPMELDDLPKRGYCVVKTDSAGVVIASAIRFQPEKSPLNEGELLVRYNRTNFWNIQIGAESFFFQEGQAQKYEQAKYGGIKVDEEGNSILVGLYDENLKKIE
jgi:uncharacterized membrane-anchored protein